MRRSSLLSLLSLSLSLLSTPAFAQRVVPARDAATGRWGFRAEGGPWVLAPEYDGVWPWPADLEPGYTEVIVGERRGLVAHDEAGARLVVPVAYDYVGSRSESGWSIFGRDSIVAVRQDGREGYLDGRTWQAVIEPVYDDLRGFGPYLAAQRDGRWGLISWRGDVVRRFRYDEIGWYYSGDGVQPGRGSARQGGRWALTDSSLTPLTPFVYDRIRYLYDLRIVARDGHAGLLDRDGRELLAPAWDSVAVFGPNGLVGREWRPQQDVWWAGVRRDSLWGLAEIWTGRVVEPRFSDLDHFRDRPSTMGYFPAADPSGRYGVIDGEGAWVVPPRHDRVFDYDPDTGRARVMLQGAVYTLDREGRRVEGE